MENDRFNGERCSDAAYNESLQYFFPRNDVRCVFPVSSPPTAHSNRSGTGVDMLSTCWPRRSLLINLPLRSRSSALVAWISYAAAGAGDDEIGHEGRYTSPGRGQTQYRDGGGKQGRLGQVHKPATALAHAEVKRWWGLSRGLSHRAAATAARVTSDCCVRTMR